MKLATYLHNGKATPGVVTEQGVVPLAAVWPGDDCPRDMIELIERWDAASLSSAPDTDAEPIADLDAQQRWLPPVPRPSKLMGVAANNRALFELASFAPDHPPIFAYPPSALTGHNTAVELREEFGLTHPEPELGVVIGRRAKRVPVDSALQHVFGYTVVDDITSPTLKSGDTYVFPAAAASALGTAGQGDASAAPLGFEHGDMQLTYHARSKGTDTFAPCGPWIVTADEVPNPDGLAVTLTIDGELCMEDNTGNLMFTVAQVVSFASEYFTLEPGDIIHMGTAGRGKYRLRDLNYQDRIGATRTIEISGVGALTNTMARNG